MQDRRLTVNEVVTRFIEEAAERYQTDKTFVVELIQQAEQHRGVVNAYSLFECMREADAVGRIKLMLEHDDPMEAVLYFVEMMNAIYRRSMPSSAILIIDKTRRGFVEIPWST